MIQMDHFFPLKIADCHGQLENSWVTNTTQKIGPDDPYEASEPGDPPMRQMIQAEHFFPLKIADCHGQFGHF